MTDRARVAQKAQVAVETTEGTAAASGFHTLPSMQIQVDMDASFNKYRPSGYKYNTVVVLGKEWTTGKVSGPMTYGEIVYALASILHHPGSNVTTTNGASTWIFSPQSAAQDTSKAYTFEWGESGSGYKSTGNYFNELTLKFTRDNVELDGATMGRRLAIAAPTAIPAVSTTSVGTVSPGTAVVVTPVSMTNIVVGSVLRCVNNDNTNAETVVVDAVGASDFTAEFELSKSTNFIITNLSGEVENVPISPASGKMYHADTFAGLSAGTLITRGFEAQFKLSKRFSPFWPINSDEASFGGRVEDAPDATFSIVFGSDNEVRNLRVNNTAYVADNIVRTASNPTYVFKCVTAGTSHATTEPAAMATAKPGDANITDGTVVWQVIENDLALPITLAKLRAGDTIYFRIEYTGSPIFTGSAANYKFTLDLAMKVTKAMKFEDVDGALLGVRFDGDVVHDATAGKAYQVTVVNAWPGLKDGVS